MPHEEIKKHTITKADATEPPKKDHVDDLSDLELEEVAGGNHAAPADTVTVGTTWTK